MIQDYSVRLARLDDVADLRRLMEESMRGHLQRFLSAEQVEASFEIMGLDTQLIEDGTYFVLERDGEAAAAGGWSFRATLYGGDHSAARSLQRLDPRVDAARIRAMYVRPDHARKGLGRKIVELSESAARELGFRRMELVATAAGLPLYLACGYAAERKFEHVGRNGARVPLVAMSRSL
jgi:GNAT superfamily N-acetyltransferase